MPRRLGAIPTITMALAVLGVVSAASAVPLLTPRADAVALTGRPGIRAARALAVDGAALAKLRAASDAVVPAVPLGTSGLVTLVLTRFSPFASDARVEVRGGPKGPREIPLPDQVYFRGTVQGEPSSRVVLTVGRSRVHGFVASAGSVYVIGPGANGAGHTSYALADVDPAVHPSPSVFCGLDLDPRLSTPRAERSPAPSAGGGTTAAVAPPTAGAPGGLVQANVAVETDRELRQKFGSTQAAADYVASLVAAVTAIYERDVDVRLAVSYLRLWEGPDPWTASDPFDALDELQAYWLAPGNDMDDVAGPRAVVHFLSGKTVQGGVAYLDAVCDHDYGFGMSQVFGSFDLGSPSQVWDVLVVAHEIGHNVGSPHTHCYDPPLDECYSGEPGCYAGVEMASQGTIMSYCHLHGGVANIDLEFGAVVGDRVGDTVAAAGCLGEPSAPTTTTTTTSTSTISVSSTTSPSGPTTTSPRPTTTTSSTINPGVYGDEDGDGVPGVRDECPDTPPGALVNGVGCVVCGCSGPDGSGSWSSRRAFLACVREEMRTVYREGWISGTERREAIRRARDSTCGRRGRTRCCLYRTPGDEGGRCRIRRADRCTARGRLDHVTVLGSGSCRPNPCVP